MNDTTSHQCGGSTPSLLLPSPVSRLRLFFTVQFTNECRTRSLSSICGSDKSVLADRTLKYHRYIASMIFERIKKDRFIWSNVSFSWMKKKDGNWDERISKFDFENCVIFFWKATMIIITFIEIILSSWFIFILKILNKFRRIIIVTVWLDYYKLLLNVYVILTIDNNLSKFYEFVYTWWNIFEKISKNNLFHFLQFSNESCWSRRWFFWNQ